MPGYANKSATDIGGIPNTITVRNIGESEQLLYTASKKSAVMGIHAANRTGGILPVSIYLKRAVTASINLKSLTSNVATLSTASAHGLFVGDSVTISSVDATFNGTYTITAVPSTVSFKYAKTASNVASTAVSPVGTATVSDAIFYLTKDLRVNNGESASVISEPFSVPANYGLYAISGVENAFDVVISVQEGVN